VEGHQVHVNYSTNANLHEWANILEREVTSKPLAYSPFKKIQIELKLSGILLTNFGTIISDLLIIGGE
jgi:hypothetical protein